MPDYELGFPDGTVVGLHSDKEITREQALDYIRKNPDQLNKKQTSTGEAVGLGAATSVLPGIGGAGGWSLGTSIALALAPESAGLSLAIPAIGALGGSLLTSKLQSEGIKAVAPQLENEIETSEREHPLASFGGSLLGGAGVFKIAPGQAIRGLAAVPSILRGTGTEAQFGAAKVAALQAGMGAGFGAAGPLTQGRLPTWADVGQGALGMAIFGEPRSKMLLPRAAAAVRDARLRDITRQAQPTGDQDALQQSAEAAGGNVPTQSQPGVREVPTQEGGAGNVERPAQAQQTQVLLSPQHEKILNDVIGSETAAGKKVRLIEAPEGANDPISGALGTIDRNAGEIVLNKEELGRLAQDYPNLDMRHLVERLIAHENIHLHTDPKEALKYWLNLSNWERMFTKRRVTGTWHGERMVQGGEKIPMNDTQWGLEAVRYRIEKLSGKTPSEFVASALKERLGLHWVDAMDYVVGGIRRNFTTRGGLEWEIINQIQENLEAFRMVLTGQATPQEIESNPFMLRKGREDRERQQELFSKREMTGIKGFGEMRAAAEGDQGAMRRAATAEKSDALADIETLRKIKAQEPLMRRKGKDPYESVLDLSGEYEREYSPKFLNDRADALMRELVDNLPTEDHEQFLSGGVDTRADRMRFLGDIWGVRDGQSASTPAWEKLVNKIVKGGEAEYPELGEVTLAHKLAMMPPSERLLRFSMSKLIDLGYDGHGAEDMINDWEYFRDEVSEQSPNLAKWINNAKSDARALGSPFMRRKGRPSKDPYEPGQSKFAIPGMPGQRPVAGKEEAERTYGELKLKAAPGTERDVMERSVTGLVPEPPTAAEWDKIAQDYLNTPIKSTTTSKDIPGKGVTPFTSYDRPNYDDFVRKNAWLKPGQAKDLWQDAVWKNLIHAPAARLQQWADALGVGFTDVSREGETRIPEPAEPVQFKLEGEDKRPAAEKKAEREALLNKEKFRSRVVLRIAEKLISEAYQGAQPLDRTSLEHDDIAFEDSRTAIGAYVEIPADAAKNEEAVKKIVADRSRPSSAVPFTHTKRLLALENKDGQVAVVSAYVAPDGKLMMVMPGEAGQRPNREFSEVTKEWTPFSSTLLRDPVQNFFKRYDSVKHFEDSIDASAALDKSKAGTYGDVYGDEFTAERVAEEPERRSYRIWGSEGEVPLGMTEQVEEESGANLGRTAVERGEGGGFMGPSAELAREGRGTVMERARALGTRDVTATEAGSLYNLITGRVKQPYSAENLKDLEAYLGKKWADNKLNPAERAAIIALQKISASVLRRMPKGTDPDIAHQSVWDQLKAIMALSDDELGFTQDVIRHFTTPTAEGAFRPKVEPPSQTQRELTMRERRPPTDVAGLPEGQARPLPEATGLGGRPQELGQVPPSGPEAFRPDVGLSPETQAALARRNITISPYASGLRPGQRPTTVGRPPGFRMAREPQMPGTARFGKKIAYDLRKNQEMVGAIIRRADREKDLAVRRDVADNLGNISGDNELQHLNMFAVSDKSPKGGDPELKRGGTAAIFTGAWYFDPKAGPKGGATPGHFEEGELQGYLSEQAKAMGAMEPPGRYAFNNKKFDKLNEFLGSLNAAEGDAKKRMAEGGWREKYVQARRLEAIQELRKGVKYAKEHWKDQNFQKYVLELRKDMDREVETAKEKGITFREADNYFPKRYEGDLLTDDGRITFADSPLILGTRFSARRTFDNPYQAIAKGPYVPATFDSAVMAAHRIRQGARARNRAAWVESLKQTADPETGEPIAVDSLMFEKFDPKDPNVVKERSFQPPTPQYIDMLVNGQHMSVLRPYERVVKSLTLESYIQQIPVLRGALEIGQRIKHGILALDIFHPMRLMYYNAAIKGGLPGYLKGSSVLEYRPSDLAKAKEMGLITPEAYAWATEPILLKAGDISMHSTRSEIVQELLKEGLNVGRIQDAIYKELVSNIPFVGEALSKYNRLIFDKITRGFMVENAVSELIRMNKENPTARLENVARQVSKDINTFYGNLGRQGWFRSQTAQDLSRIMFLAPMWVEGLIKKEASFVGRPVMKGVNMAMGNKTAPLNDTVMRGIGRGLVASFALTQIINLMTRQKPTWQNEEEGHKWDAWVPNMSKEKGPGFFISPLSVFADISHDIIRMFESKPNAWEGLRQIGENKLGPWGRMGIVMMSQRSPTGAYLPTVGSVASSAASQLLPVPISGSKLGQQALSYTGLVRPPPPGSVQRQAMASLGIKTEVGPTVVHQMQTLANKYVAENKLRTEMVHIEAIDNPSYAKLRGAIEAGDDAYAKRMYGKLKDMGVDDKKIINEMRRWAKHPFTGSNKNERAFLHSLSEQDRDRYATAMQEKQQTLEKFYQFYMKQP